MTEKEFSVDIAGKTITLKTGKLAKLATSSILAQMGATIVLATVVEGKVRADLGYFPLTVEYIERLYAGGRIKGSRWVKREGRPTDEAILTARLIDRSIRPLFPKSYKNEVQVIVTVLSVDGEHEADVLSLVAVSSALAISRIPWNGPIGAVRMGCVKEKENDTKEFLVNPRSAEIALSELDLVASQSKDKTIMLEAGARQVSEEVVLEAIEKAQEENKKIIVCIEDMVKQVGSPKTNVSEDSKFYELTAKVEKSYKAEIEALVERRATKEGGDSESENLLEKILEYEKTNDPKSDVGKDDVAKAVEYVSFKTIRENVLKRNKRVDGRGIDEIRPLFVETSVLPRTHGSAIFQRGTTQVLSIATLGSPRLGQLIESPEGEETKRYMHHYSMPPYSVGEAGRIGVPSRREIGHGALAERALLGVIPSQEKFPYAIRVVSEILSSNGSTSMAATCGSTLSLMDAGVPIEKPVAGIAMGMISSAEKYVVLTDILGLEDFSGDMDFKVAGTDSGITAIQLDVKIPGLTIVQIKEILERAKAARLLILEKMLSVIVAPRTQVSAYAPKIEQVKIPVEKIGEVIGPGGRVIRNIMAETAAVIDVDDDGTVTVSGTTEESVRKASDWIKGLTREVMAGEVFEGTVKRILPFGAFVEILPGKEGMVHVSHMTSGFVKNPSDVVSLGDKVTVKVIEIDEQGRTNLSMLLEGKQEQQQQGAREERFSPRKPEESAHPLTRQFRREQSGQRPGGWSRDRGGFARPRPNPRFRKVVR